MKNKFKAILSIALALMLLMPNIFSDRAFAVSGYTGNLVYADGSVFVHDKNVKLNPARAAKYVLIVTDDGYVRMREIELYDESNTKLTLENGISSIKGVGYKDGSLSTDKELLAPYEQRPEELLDGDTESHKDFQYNDWTNKTAFLIELSGSISISKIKVYTGILNNNSFKHAVKIYLSESLEDITVGSEAPEGEASTLMLEDFTDFSDFSVMKPTADGYAPPTFQITDTDTDTGNGLQVNWASTESLKSYVHKFEPTADWAKKTFAQNANNYTYFRIWVSNPSFVPIELTVRLYSSSTKVYMNSDSAVVSRKDGTQIIHSNGNATGTGANSSVTLPSAFSGWVAYPIDTDCTTGSGGRANISNFSEVNAIQIDMRRPETYDTGNYYVLDDICLSSSSVGAVKAGEGDGEGFEGLDEPIETELKNVIVLVGDGMGQTILQAARERKGSALNMDGMWYKSTAVSTNNVYEQLTDSAAAGTALSCGIRTANTYISVDTTGAYVENMVEYFTRANKKTGIVTTSYLLDATPTAYGSHGMRNDYANLANGLFKNNISVLIGGGKNHFGTQITHNNQKYTLLDYAQSVCGYTYVDSAEALNAFNGDKVLGLYGNEYMDYELDRTSQPSISALTEKAISLLENEDDGFFLMVEGGNIDHAAHNNDFNRTVTDTLAFDDAVRVALDYMEENPDTLVVVCADHSTGGLTATDSGYKFTTNGHDASLTACFASGLGSRYFGDIKENADIANAVRKATVKSKSVESSATGEITYYNELCDINLDSTVTVIDLLAIKKAIAYSSVTAQPADINRDGYINSSDLIKMKRILLGDYT